MSHDTHNNTYQYKHTFSVEIVPICKVRVTVSAHNSVGTSAAASVHGVVGCGLVFVE